jgi:peptide/nickel transport system substrate-binding protein
VLLRQLTELRMMDKEWSEKNRSVEPKDIKTKDENHAHRNANGTGPFVLQSWQPDAKTVLKRNPNWWDKPSGNVDEVVFTPIKAAATRTAALLSNQVDFVNDPPVQDLDRLRASGELKVVDGAENRTIFLGMDQQRDELLYSNVKGKNPLKDRRVRQALYQAIDIEGLKKTTMRDLSVPTGTLIAPMVHGWMKDLEARPAKHDPTAAKKLLADAGYPEGFEITLDCPNDRYVNDQQICQAVTAMWSRIGMKVRLQSAPMATYIQKIQKYDTSVYMLGWGVATMDALYTLDSLVHTADPQGGAAGNFNLGRYSNRDVDGLIAQIRIATDEKKRDALIHEALAIVKDDYGYLPLHHQIRPWVMRKNIDTVYRADDRPVPWWTTVKQP